MLLSLDRLLVDEDGVSYLIVLVGDNAGVELDNISDGSCVFTLIERSIGGTPTVKIDDGDDGNNGN